MNKSDKCTFCYFEKGHNIETCSYSVYRAKQLHKELILLITYRAELKYEPYWYVQDLIERYASRRDLDALISFHSSDLQKYIKKLLGEGIFSEKESKMDIYSDKKMIVASYYYDKVDSGTFKIAEDDIPTKKFHIKTRTITETSTSSENTFDCPVCLSTIENNLCMMYDFCNHKICSDCFCEMTKRENKFKIKKLKCCLCRNNVNMMLFLDENTRLDVLSCYKIGVK
jgi:hypothetical protein